MASAPLINLQIEVEGRESKTLFKNQTAVFDARGNVMLAPLLEKIKSNGFDDFAGATISYFSWLDKAFVFVGRDPI
jgi:hypothetical protein